MIQPITETNSTEQLEISCKVVQELIAFRDLDALLNQIVKQVVQLLDGDRGNLYLYRAERNVLDWMVTEGEQMIPAGVTLIRDEGLPGRVWTSGQALVVNDYESWPDRSAKWVGQRGSVVGVPIQTDDKFLGVMTVERDADAGHPFNADDAARLSRFVSQVAVIIQNACLVDASRRETQELTALHETAVAIGGELETEALLIRLYEQVQQLINPDSFGVYIYHADGKSLEIALAMEMGEHVPGAARMRLPLNRSGLTGWVMQTRQPLLVCDMETETLPVEPKHLTQPPARSWLGVPLIARGQLIGAISVQSFRPWAFGEADRRFLMALAALAAIAIDNAQLYEQAQTEIMERKRTEEALAKSERFNRRILEAAPIPILYLDVSGVVIYENPANRQWYQNIKGGTSSLVGTHISEALPIEAVGASYILEQVFAGETIVGEVIEDHSLTGSEIRLQVYGAPVMDAQGELEGVILMAHDITKQWQAEQIRNATYRISEAAHSVRGLHDLFASIRSIILEFMSADNFYIALYDAETDMVSFPYIVDEYDQLSPKKPGKGLTAYVLRTGEPLLASPEVFADLVQQGEIELLGTPAVDWLGVPLKTTDKIIGVLAVQTYTEDVRLKEKDKEILKFVSTQAAMAIERKRAEEEIHRRNRELTLLNRIISASAASLDPKYILETVCRELALAFNVDQAAAALLNADKTAGIIEAEYLAEGQLSALNQTLPVIHNPSFEYLLTHKAPLAVVDTQSDPRVSPVRTMLKQRGIISLLHLPLVIEDEVVGSLALGSDHSRDFSSEEVSLAWNAADQVSGALARAQLVQAHQRLSAAIEQAFESVIITDAKGTIVYVNPAFERTSGYSRAEALGQTPRILNSGKQDEAFYRELWTTITAGRVWQEQVVNQKKDGSFYTDEVTISPVRDKNGAIVNYVSVQRDVTRELQLEEQYRQAQKMEAVGRLTGGIAHDFNNLLTAINGFAELLQLRLPSDDPHQKLVMSILSSGQRAADLVSQLMAFSRKQVIKPKIVDLNKEVFDMDKLLRRVISEDIDLATNLAPDLWPVKVDPAQIGQVIVNLVVNARDAMPEGGRLTIETTNVVLDEGYAAGHLGVQPGEYVLLAISDTGLGMNEEVKAHIFEPFFTTKETGKGTGLGLATIYGIVKQSEGDIQVYSEEGQGTTFKIYLPRAGETTAIVVERGQATGMPQGTETVLLVEDELAVRRLAAHMLGELGYTVLNAANGQKALTVAQSHREPIHLLLTDVVMPQMGGKELANQLREMHPETKVLFMSGYTDNAIVRHGVLEEGVAFIQKPFSAVLLARKLREVLEELS